MIWFGNVPGLAPLSASNPALTRRTPRRERDQMRQALEWVATYAPHLTGSALVEALAETGCVDADTAARLLPQFRYFDADHHFADHLRRLSYRGTTMAGDFRAGVARAVEDAVGHAALEPLGTGDAIRFTVGEREGILLAYAEVKFAIGGAVRDGIAAAVEAMPDTLIIVARNFHPGTAGQLQSLLAGREVPGTLLTLNLLLGVRAMALRYRPAPDRVIDLLSGGRPLRSADVATLGDPVPAVQAV